MNGSAHDDEVRTDFRRLRDRDEVRAGSFSHAWSVATRRAAAARPERRVHWLAPAAAVVALLIAGLLVDWTVPDARPVAESRPPPATRAPLSQWRAPSDVLLATSGRELRRDVPRLGTPEMGWTHLPTEEI